MCVFTDAYIIWYTTIVVHIAHAHVELIAGNYIFVHIAAIYYTACIFESNQRVSFAVL